MKSRSVKEIRSLFVDFFKRHGHQHLPSSSLVPHNDPTLLFANSGMVQFKEFFTGRAQPQHRRVVTVQKCVRAGGKHNDLENVGFTARHHTFFEMLGNFSFGDYFKNEAIAFAWDFLTETLGIPKDRLYVTVHHSDNEAAEIWTQQQGVPKDRIFYRGDKDNFWEMGETGPCGPSSEIFYDHGEKYADPNHKKTDCLLDDELRYVELWNLVFMQFERYRDGNEIKQRPLPNPCVDTGSGLERVAAALQNCYNNFDTDSFTPIVRSIENVSGKKVSDAKYAAWIRVVADHVRSGAMLLADGVLPSNEGRGYVLRRILRRAIRHLDLLGVEVVALPGLVPSVLQVLGETYPELLTSHEFIAKYLQLEEESFRQTLRSGLNLLEAEISALQSKKGKVLDGAHIFKLYDTHGFPVDLTEMILRERGLSADHSGFEKHMNQQRERSKKASEFAADAADLKGFYSLRDKNGATKFLGYQSLEAPAKLIGVEKLGKHYALIFDQTPFYAESGGQSGDCGEVLVGGKVVARVIDTMKPIDDLFAHVVDGDPGLKVNLDVQLKVDTHRRRRIMSNHTATHLLHAALQKVLGHHVKQAGSSVGPDRLRFDFTHPEAVTSAQIKEVEKLVNDQIASETPVGAQVMSKDEAQKRGAMALFGEKYGDQVRVIDIGSFSMELCGGTHVNNTSVIRFFKITSEGALASGVRRIEAVTGDGAAQFITDSLSQLQVLEQMLSVKSSGLVGRVEQILTENHQRQKELEQLKAKFQSSAAEKLFDDVTTLKDGHVFKHIEAEADMDLRSLGDQFMTKHTKGIALITAQKGDKLSVLLRTYRGNDKLNCSDFLKEALKNLGGSGGGRPDMAQGSIDAAKVASLKDRLSNTLLGS